MSKKFIIGLLFLGLFFVQSKALAVENNSSGSNTPTSAEVKLPDPGLTPKSPFYFLETASEAVREFLTFNPEAKAKLQTERALERIAEVKAILAEEEVNPKGIDVALSRLQATLIQAASIIQKEQEKGKDVSSLAKRLDTDFEIRNRLLKQALGEKSDQIELSFKQQRLELKKQLIDAKLAGKTQKVSEIILALDKLKQEKESQESLLEQKEKETESVFEAEEGKFEQAQREKEQELEEKEKETESILEKKKEDLKKQFKEAEEALDAKEKSLEDQFNLALSLGDKQMAERIKTQLLAITNERAVLDAESEESGKALEEADRNFGALLVKKGRNFEDFEREKELILEKADPEIEKAFEEKKSALEGRFEAQKNKLEIQEKQLKLQILEVRQSCQQTENSSGCVAEKVAPLQDKLVQIKKQKGQLEIDQEQVEQKIELEEEAEQELEVEEKEESDSSLACPKKECGPVPGMPNQRCEDGSIAGPVCVRISDNRCGWQIKICEKAEPEQKGKEFEEDQKENKKIKVESKPEEQEKKEIQQKIIEKQEIKEED